jgi:hypothetical protein
VPSLRVQIGIVAVDSYGLIIGGKRFFKAPGLFQAVAQLDDIAKREKIVANGIQKFLIKLCCTIPVALVALLIRLSR